MTLADPRCQALLVTLRKLDPGAKAPFAPRKVKLVVESAIKDTMIRAYSQELVTQLPLLGRERQARGDGNLPSLGRPLKRAGMIVSAVLALALPGCARVEVAKGVGNEKSGALDLVRQLSQDIGPRFSGTPGNAAAVAWALDAMKALGLSNVRAEKVSVPHWVRGDEAAEVTAPVARKLRLTALGGSVGTPDGGSEAEVIEVGSLSALEALPDDQLRGKFVFFNQTPERTRDGKGYGKISAVRRAGPGIAGKKGAAGWLMRSISTATSGGPHTGGTAHGADTVRIPAAALGVEDAAFLHALLAQGAPVRIHLWLGCQDLPRAEGANVVGEVPGTDLKSQVVLLGAHLDSWDIAPGALDDGAGVAIVLDVAHALRAIGPRRTVRVVLFANEEFGLDGADAYAAAHQAELPDHVLALEMDRGAGRVFALSYLAGPEADAPIAAAAARLRELGVGAPTRGEEHGADLHTLRKAGVPVMELEQDATAYFDVHHSVDDTFDKVDPAALAQAVAVTLSFVEAISQSAGALGRVPPAKR